MAEYVKTSSAQGVALKFSSEENGEMLPVWTYDKDRSGDCWTNGLGIEGEKFWYKYDFNFFIDVR